MTNTERGHGWKWPGFGWLLWLACSFVTAAETGSPQTARQWLDAMVDAMRSRGYQATVVYSRENDLRLFKLTHQVRGGVVYEHFQALGDPLRQVVREADKVTCYFPDRRIRVEYHNRPDSLFTSLFSRWEEQERYYRLELGRRGHRIGRPSQEIVIAPLDEYRYGRRIWIDVSTRLPLKFELQDRQGNILEALAVTDLGSDPELEAERGGMRGHEDWKLIRREEAEPIESWRLTKLPPGFREVHRSHRLVAGSDATVDHLLVSDGLATVSVYIIRNEGKDFDSGILKRGGVSVFRRKAQGHVITVVGDVPMITVRTIGEGIRMGE